MAKVVVTASANADTAFILRDLAAKAGVNVAARYNSDIDPIYRRLEQFPQSGSPRPSLGQLVRIDIVSPYNIIHEYNVIDDAVTIFRIVHGRRRITRRMLNRPTPRP